MLPKDLTDEQFSRLFTVIDVILEKYKVEIEDDDNDNYVALIAHIITLIECTATFGVDTTIQNDEIAQKNNYFSKK